MCEKEAKWVPGEPEGGRHSQASQSLFFWQPAASSLKAGAVRKGLERQFLTGRLDCTRRGGPFIYSVQIRLGKQLGLYLSFLSLPATYETPSLSKTFSHFLEGSIIEGQMMNSCQQISTGIFYTVIEQSLCFDSTFSMELLTPEAIYGKRQVENKVILLAISM